MPDAPPERRLIRNLKLVALSVTPAVLLLILLEVVASVSIARRAHTVPNAAGGSTYTMRIGRWPWSRASVTVLNSLGYPDAEFPAVAQKQGCVHVVLSGDSFVFGDGVDRDSNFVEIVRRRLAADPAPRCVRLFNIGVRGTTIDRQMNEIRKTFERIKPDVVLLVQYQNDLIDLNSPGAILDPNRERNQRLRAGGDSVRVGLRIFRANLVKMLTYQSFAFMIRNDIKRDVLRHWSVIADSTRHAEASRFKQTYDSLYADLVAELRRRRVGFGVLIVPSKPDVLAGRYPEEDFFLELARAHQVPTLRLFPTFDAHRNPYAFLMYDGHLNARGNRLIAEELHQWLFTRSPAPFPELRQAGNANVR